MPRRGRRIDRQIAELIETRYRLRDVIATARRHALPQAPSV